VSRQPAPHSGFHVHDAVREARRRWAELLRQVFEVDPLRCPACGREMRIVAFITQRAVIDRILDHLRRARGAARGLVADTH
jgi:hypothetical protein